MQCVQNDAMYNVSKFTMTFIRNNGCCYLVYLSHNRNKEMKYKLRMGGTKAMELRMQGWDSAGSKPRFLLVAVLGMTGESIAANW